MLTWRGTIRRNLPIRFHIPRGLGHRNDCNGCQHVFCLRRYTCFCRKGLRPGLLCLSQVSVLSLLGSWIFLAGCWIFHSLLFIVVILILSAPPFSHFGRLSLNGDWGEARFRAQANTGLSQVTREWLSRGWVCLLRVVGGLRLLRSFLVKANLQLTPSGAFQQVTCILMHRHLLTQATLPLRDAHVARYHPTQSADPLSYPSGTRAPK